MDFRFSPEQEAFRQEFVAWLEKNLPDNWDPSRYRNYDSTEEWARSYCDFQKRLSNAGYVGLQYHEKYGGLGPGPR